MKQRLLLALLVLFAAAGMVKADEVSITTGQNAGVLTVTVGGFSGVLTATDGNNSTDGIKISGGTITFPNKTTETTWKVSGAFTSMTISSYYHKVTNISISTSGNTNLTELKVPNEAVTTISGTDNIATLDISKNLTYTTDGSADFSTWSSLEKLTCSNCGLSSLTIPTSVTTLDCSENKLTTVTRGTTPIVDNLDGFTITWGKQYLSYTGDTKKANEWFDLATLITSSGLNLPFSDLTGTTFSNFQIKQDNGTYSTNGAYPVKHSNATAYPTQYKFYSSTKYEPGTYRVEVKNSDAKFSKRTYCIDFEVGAPSFTINFDGSKVTVENTSSVTTGDPIKQGTKLTIKAVVPDNKVFDAFTVKGLTTPEANKSEATVEVIGPKPTDLDQSISVAASFKAIQATLTINNPGNGGSFTVKKKDTNTTFASGAKIDYGTTIEIIPNTPSSDYEIEMVTVNGAPINVSSPSQKYYHEIKTEKVVVSGSFKRKGVANRAVFTIDPNLNAKMTVKLTSGTSTSNSTLTFTDGKTAEQSLASNISLEITPQGNNNIVVKDIRLNGTSIGEDKIFKNGTTYNATFPVAYVNGKATIAIDAVELSTLDITLNAQTFIYTGKPIAYTNYKTTPENVSGGKFTYVKSSDASAPSTGYSDNVPVDAGTYFVKYERAADDLYAKVTEISGSNKITINPATLEVTPPTVETYLEGGILKYRVNGSTSYNGVNGGFEVYAYDDTKNTDDEKYKLIADKIVPDGKRDVTHLVAVKFIPKSDKDKGNYETSYIVVPAKVGSTNIEMCTITASSLPANVQVKVKNGGGALQALSTPIAKGTTVKLVFTTPSNLKITAVAEDAASPKVLTSNATVTDNISEDIKLTASISIKLITESVAAPTKDLTITLPDDKDNTYDGKVQTYSGSIVVKGGTSTLTSGTDYNYTISYKLGDKEVTSPVDAGIYTVICKVTPLGATAKTYKVTTKTSNCFIIKKGTPTVASWPIASKIGKGQSLAGSVLTGGMASTEGSFVWIEPTIKPTASKAYQVKFVPKNANNYEEKYGEKTPGESDDSKQKDGYVYVEVSDKAIISLISEHGTITAKDASGKVYKTGDEIVSGTTLTFTTTPDKGYELVSPIKVNGTAISGNTYKTTTTSITVTAEFTLKPFTVTVTKPSKGAVVTLPSSNKVKKGESYSFTVACLTADKSKIVVKDGSTVITGTDGKYTISNITADKAISITLDNPTAITVAADTTLSPHKKPMGTVKITGTTDGKCYYGETVTVKATPVSGVQFAGWTGTTETTATFSFKATQPSYKFKAKYTGSPTGIETIEGLRVYGSEGYVFVGCDTEATVTLIHMNGRMKKVQISGDSRIEAAAGIYGVIVEKGTEVLKTKVIVR